MNVVPFEAFDSPRQIQAHAAGLPRVILEGPSDVTLFQEWFGDLMDRLDFVDAEKVIGAGGCTMVAKAVEKSRKDDDIPAVGVVDRDVFHREKKWDILFDIDDEAFAKATRSDDVFTTSLWEVEAYLICPELLPDWVAMQRDPQPAPVDERQSALTRTLEECEGLLSAVSFFCASHSVGAACDIKHFSTVEHHGIEAASAASLAKAPQPKQDAASAIDPLLAKIRAAAPTTAPERLRFLLRYVDTKRLLARLQQRLKLRDGAHWALGVQMSRAGVRPQELEAFLTEAAERLAA